MLNIINQNQKKNLLPFKNSNHAKLIIFPSYECQRILSKNSFDSILNFGFNLGHLKMYTYHVRWNQFWKGLSKRFI
jgi:hypothetical protein